MKTLFTIIFFVLCLTPSLMFADDIYPFLIEEPDLIGKEYAFMWIRIILLVIICVGVLKFITHIIATSHLYSQRLEDPLAEPPQKESEAGSEKPAS